MDIFPAIDLLDGKAVRLRQGKYDEVTVYSDDPASFAAAWSGVVPGVHVVDLEGARQGQAVQTDLVRAIVAAFDGDVQMGGGIRGMEALESYFALGVRRAVIGTAAIKDPQFLEAAVSKYPGRIVVALDAKDGRVATEGWLDDSGIRAVDVANNMRDLPIAAVLYTDIARDGTEVGPNVAATAELAAETGLPVIASGGVGTLDHLRELTAANHGVLTGGALGITGAIVGRALHEGRFTLEAAVAAARAES